MQRNWWVSIGLKCRSASIHPSFNLTLVAKRMSSSADKVAVHLMVGWQWFMLTKNIRKYGITPYIRMGQVQNGVLYLSIGAIYTQKPFTILL